MHVLEEGNRLQEKSNATLFEPKKGHFCKFQTQKRHKRPCQNFYKCPCQMFPRYGPHDVIGNKMKMIYKDLFTKFWHCNSRNGALSPLERYGSFPSNFLTFFFCFGVLCCCVADLHRPNLSKMFLHQINYKANN